MRLDVGTEDPARAAARTSVRAPTGEVTGAGGPAREGHYQVRSGVSSARTPFASHTYRRQRAGEHHCGSTAYLNSQSRPHRRGTVSWPPSQLSRAPGSRGTLSSTPLP